MDESKNEIVVYDSKSIRGKIYTVHEVQVMLDSDLAEFYGVETKQLNRAVKRNIDRFPKEFMFQLGEDEWEDLRFQIGTSKTGRGRRCYLPYVFTEKVLRCSQAC
ncbi:ORF6N domain protein [bacterium BMS3Abin03]|nr:ORF6N domain protein [bacterium BMS3Abin03]